MCHTHICLCHFHFWISPHHSSYLNFVTPNCNCCDCALAGGVADGDGVGGVGGGGGSGDSVGDGGGGVGGGGSGGALYMQRLGGGGSVLARAPLGVNGTKWQMVC